MQKTKARTLTGFMELLPEKQILFNKMKNIIEHTFIVNGLSPMDTPVLEYSQVLLAKAGGETEKQIYRFAKGDNDLCMRFDLTVPFAKYVALYYHDLNFPFRRYQIGKVFRGERAQKGRLREFYQCDMDIISNSELELIADAECIDVLSQIFENLNQEIVIRVNNRKIINGLLEEFNLVSSMNEILNILDKKDKIGYDKTLQLLSAHTQRAKYLLDIFEIKSLEDLKLNNFKNKLIYEGIEELKQILNILNKKQTKAEIVFDLSIIRGLDYYTGIVFEANLKNINEKVSVGAGGRYDNLTEHFCDEKFSGVGVSIGLSRLFDLLDKNNLLNFFEQTSAIVALLPFENFIDQAFCIENILKENNIPVENVYYKNKNFKNKLNYINKKGINFLIVIGEDEIKSNIFQIKNMITGETQKLHLDEIIKYVKEYMKEENKILSYNNQ